MMKGEVFLTGATGFIGSGLLGKWLAAEPDVRISVLVRDRRGELPRDRVDKILGELFPEMDAAEVAARVRVVAGDISLGEFGLHAEEYHNLAGRTSHIIHCAAAVRFDLPLEEARAINVVGSENAVALAKACKHLERLDYVGTAYVAGRRTGVIREEELDKGQDHNNTYEQTKLESEKMMRQAMSDLPITILRPSIVICDSRTGRISRYSAIFRVLRMYHLGYLRVLPGYSSTMMDLVPMDYVADAVYAIGRDSESLGKCFHLAAGPAKTTSLAEVVRLAAEHFGRERLALASPREFDALVARRAGEISEDERDMLDELEIYQPYLASSPEFDTSNTLKVAGRAGITLPPLASYFGRMAAYIRSMT
jgi:thioester reductase-like protein